VLQNPWPGITHFGLAAALGLKGDFDEAKTALAASLKLNPEARRVNRSRASPERRGVSVGAGWDRFRTAVAATYQMGETGCLR
jgi:hypothetical protein